MALKDFEAFCREKLLAWDPDVDAAPGSPLDVTFIQPLLGRIGTDPFSTNLPLFIRSRLAQEYPELALKEGDALIDLLVKGAELLLDPLNREINRIAMVQSFSDPTLLNTDEAAALGANLFAYLKKGELATGTIRIYFATPRSKSVNPSDYAVSKTGLLFYPTAEQSIKADEMLYNTEGSQYYFDVSVVAEAAGDQYNVDPDSITSAPTITDAVRVTNKARTSSGVAAETAPQFIDRAEQSLSEKSLSSVRGIVTKLTQSFPEITRIAVVGYRDPEMNRDEIVGGGIGSIALQGQQGLPFSDGQNGVNTARIRVADAVDFTQIIAAPNTAVSDFTITLINAWGPSAPSIRDIDVSYVLDDRTLQLATADVVVGSPYFQWALRKKTLTLSAIPGGILFPEGPTGNVSVAENTIHIGGCTDIYVKGAGFDARTLSLDAVADDQPLYSGTMGRVPTGLGNLLILGDFCSSVGTPMQRHFSILETDTVVQQLEAAVANGYMLEVISPSATAGLYQITRVYWADSRSPSAPLLEVKSLAGSNLVDLGEAVVWKIQDDIDIELLDPKEQKWEGYDLNTYVGDNIVDTDPPVTLPPTAPVNFAALGVGAGDVLRILDGNDAGDHTISSTGGPFNEEIILALPLKSSAVGLHYIVFRANKTGGMQMPLVRVTEVDILDSTNQPTGSTVPFGAPVYCRGEKFGNAGIGSKVNVSDACLGIVGTALQYDAIDDAYTAKINGRCLRIGWLERGTLFCPSVWRTAFITFNPGHGHDHNYNSLSEMVTTINQQLGLLGLPAAAYAVDTNRLGIAPIAPYTWVDAAAKGVVPSSYGLLFGNALIGRWAAPITSRDIRSDYVSSHFGWQSEDYDIEYDQDAVDLISGVQVGHYDLLRPAWSLLRSATLTPPLPLVTAAEHYRLNVAHDFNPEASIHIRVGQRSVGWARTYYLEPVTIEYGRDAVFKAALEQGGQLQYIPDPWVSAQRIPAYPVTGAAHDGTFTSYSTGTTEGVFQSVTPEAKFLTSGIVPGDIFTVQYRTIHGTAPLPTNVDTAGKRLVLSVADSPDYTVLFVADTSMTTVSRQHVCDQINQAVGLSITKLDGTNAIAFVGDYPIVIRAKAGPTYANTDLSLDTVVDTVNQSASAGTYLILEVTSYDSGGVWVERVRFRTVAGTPVVGAFDQHFVVRRPGTQRISSTEMSTNIDSATGLYFFDVQLASKGLGDLWNVDAGVELKVEGYRGYGYYLYTKNENLTFSMAEDPWMSLPAVYYPVGVADDPSNAVNILGQNVKINYDSSALVEEVQNYVMSETDRNTNSSPLVRHLVPYAVRLNVSYVGGSKASVVKADAVTYIQNLYPSQSLTAYNVQSWIANRGGTDMTNPITVMAVVQQVDRSVWMEMSQDRVNTGRLAAFLPDVLTFTRRTA